MLTVIHEWHTRLYVVLVVYFAGMGLWSLFNAARGGERSPRYSAALAIGEVTLVLESLLGLALVAGGLRPAQLLLHIGYSLGAVLALPLAGVYTAPSPPRQQQLIAAGVCLVICGLIWRGSATGQLPGF